MPLQAIRKLTGEFKFIPGTTLPEAHSKRSGGFLGARIPWWWKWRLVEYNYFSLLGHCMDNVKLIPYFKL